MQGPSVGLPRRCDGLCPAASRIRRTRARGSAGRVLRGTGRGSQSLCRRAREMALLHDRPGAGGEGQGQVSASRGNPGMGKSRLLAEIRRSVWRDRP